MRRYILVMQPKVFNLACYAIKVYKFQWKKIYMLAVGTGIAPMSQVIQTVLNNDSEDTLVQLLYGCRTYEDVLMKEEIQEWSRYWNFSCQYYLSQVMMTVACIINMYLLSYISIDKLYNNLEILYLHVLGYMK